MRLAEPGDAAWLGRFCGDSLTGTYIMSRFCTYANDYSFARCYVDRRQDAIVTALSVLDGNAVLRTGETTDYEELLLFLQMLAPQGVMTDAAAADMLQLPVVQEKQSFRFAARAASFRAVDEAPLRDIYELISASIPGSFPLTKDAYMRFLSDYMFRFHRGRARMKAILQNDRLCACALTVAESDAGAVISGVACAEDCRGKGYGKTVVCALTQALQQENKTVHVIALHDEAAAFYRRIGFRDSDRVVWLGMK